MHVLVIQQGSCTLFETWSSTYSNPGWSCGSGAKFDLSSDALRPDGWTSADAAGLPVLPGLVKVSEVNAGAIKHAMRFTMDSAQQGYIHPATHAAGKTDATLPPMGLRLRLKASFDTSPFSGPTLVILTAMKQYGLILADNGSDWYVSGDSDDGWTALIDQLVWRFDKVLGQRLRGRRHGHHLDGRAVGVSDGRRRSAEGRVAASARGWTAARRGPTPMPRSARTSVPMSSRRVSASTGL